MKFKDHDYNPGRWRIWLNDQEVAMTFNSWNTAVAFLSDLLLCGTGLIWTVGGDNAGGTALTASENGLEVVIANYHPWVKSRTPGHLVNTRKSEPLP